MTQHSTAQHSIEGAERPTFLWLHAHRHNELLALGFAQQIALVLFLLRRMEREHISDVHTRRHFGRAFGAALRRRQREVVGARQLQTHATRHLWAGWGCMPASRFKASASGKARARRGEGVAPRAVPCLDCAVRFCTLIWRRLCMRRCRGAPEWLRTAECAAARCFWSAPNGR